MLINVKLHVILKCHLYKIIVNPSGTFKNTNIETYSLIFIKGTPTEKIEYYTVGTGEKLGEFTRAQLEANDWDISPKFKLSIRNISKYEYVKLGTLITLHKGDLQATKSDSGQYPVISISNTRTHSIHSVDGEYVYIASTSSGNSSGPFETEIKYYNGKCAVTSLMNRIKIIDTKIYIYKFLYYYLLYNKSYIEKQCEKGTANKTLHKENFLALDVPIPPFPIQEEIVTNLDRLFANPQDMKETLAFTDRAMDLMLQDPTGARLEDLVESIRLRRHYQTSADFVKRQMAAVMRSVSARGFEQKKLGDVCNAINGKPITASEKEIGGEYPVMGGGMDYVGNYSKFNREGETISISKSGASAGIVKYHICKYWAGDCFTILPKDTSIQIKYLYNYLKTNNHIIMSRTTGSTIPHCKWDDIINLEIPIPSLPIQIEILAILNEMEAELKILEQMATKAETRARFILDGYLSTSIDASAPLPSADEPLSPVFAHEFAAAPAAAPVVPAVPVVPVAAAAPVAPAPAPAPAPTASTNSSKKKR
jgi:restriction endonuclease S subunit